MAWVSGAGLTVVMGGGGGGGATFHEARWPKEKLSSLKQIREPNTVVGGGEGGGGN